MVRKRAKVKKKKSSFFKKHSNFLSVFLRIAIIFVVIGAFAFIVYKAYVYTGGNTDIENLPTIVRQCKEIKSPYHVNDGKVFSNQDKHIYENLSKNHKKKAQPRSQEPVEEFSHHQIFEIIEDIKKK